MDLKCNSAILRGVKDTCNERLNWLFNFALFGFKQSRSMIVRRRSLCYIHKSLWEMISVLRAVDFILLCSNFNHWVHQFFLSWESCLVFITLVILCLVLVYNHWIVPLNNTVRHFIIKDFSYIESSSTFFKSWYFVTTWICLLHMTRMPHMKFSTCDCVTSNESTTTSTTGLNYLVLTRSVAMNDNIWLTSFVWLVLPSKTWYWAFRHPSTQVIKTSFEFIQLLLTLIIVFNAALGTWWCSYNIWLTLRSTTHVLKRKVWLHF